MSRLTLLIALALAVPAAAQESYDVTGEHVAIYNIAGSHALEPAPGRAVTVRVTAQGRDAARLTVDRGTIDGRAALVVRYPGSQIVYRSGRRGNFQTVVRMRDDGTFSDNDWTRGDRQEGRRVTVRASGDGLEAWADLRIGVPQGQRVSLYTAVGIITATNVNGTLRLDGGATEVTTSGTRGALVVDVGSGGVDVRDAEGDVDVDTGSGSVQVNGIRGDILRVDTGSGSVRGDALTVQMLDIDTGSGSVTLGTASARAVRIDTGSGGVTLTLTSRPETVEIDTGSGGVTLTVPAGYGATVDLETGSGGIEVDFPLTVRRWSRDHVTGSIGDGSGRLSVDTGSGSIRIRQGS